ncbi:hypothetical protein BVG16_12755 [Paenibacillus selenitireducens]|uniref:SLH domain-containing protein n=1 Tax=Paenibacillus selenitireducens TaxID=1324314 RepID=A0A1T2XFV3_9BACL|nr:S-layer homology domain-containing protein [Paenibacillus selenitireducens]OPA78715.1 hypothetical protein BVG16_12755 [Paenibacillus selenitireducens]
MKLYKRQICVAILSISMLCINLGPTYAKGTSFSDVTAEYWGYASIQWAFENKIVDGYPDGTFKPDKVVSQSEFLAMLIRAFQPNDFILGTHPAHWDEPYLNYVDKIGWKVKPTNKTFSRGTAAQYLANAAGQNYNVADSIQYLLDLGLANGKTTRTVKGFYKDDTLSRTEVVVFIERLRLDSKALQPISAVEEKYNRSENVLVYNNTEYHFTLTLPKTWENKFEVVDTKDPQSNHILKFINKTTKYGVLFTIAVWPKDYWIEREEEIKGQIPAVKVGEYGDHAYIFHTPTDVQYDPSDNKSMEDYKAMFKDVQNIKSSFEIIL